MGVIVRAVSSDPCGVESAAHRLTLFAGELLEPLCKLEDFPGDPLPLLGAVLPMVAGKNPLHRGIPHPSQFQQSLHLREDTVLVLVNGWLSSPQDVGHLPLLQALFFPQALDSLADFFLIQGIHRVRSVIRDQPSVT